MTRLMVVVTSTRPGRRGPAVAGWFHHVAEAHPAFDVSVVDLLELDLPFFDEPDDPAEGRYTRPHTKRWAELVASADAFVLVTPEYNHGMTAPIKNALDYLGPEWQHKPIGYVSYGGVAGGTRAVQMLKEVAISLAMVPTSSNVVIARVSSLFEGNTFVVPAWLDDAARDVLDEIARLDEALRPLRSRQAMGKIA